MRNTSEDLWIHHQITYQPHHREHPAPPAIQAWKIYLHDQGRTKILSKLLADLSLLADFLPADKPLGQITTKDLEDFLEWLQNDRNVPCSPKTLSPPHHLD
jgi:integrase/recombinase XerD